MSAWWTSAYLTSVLGPNRSALGAGERSRGGDISTSALVDAQSPAFVSLVRPECSSQRVAKTDSAQHRPPMAFLCEDPQLPGFRQQCETVAHGAPGVMSAASLPPWPDGKQERDGPPERPLGMKPDATWLPRDRQGLRVPFTKHDLTLTKC
jgi:hypothetical protein